MEFAGAAFGIVLHKVTGLLFNQVGLICNVVDDLKKLQRTLSKVQIMLDYVEKHGRNITNNEALKLWVEDVDRFSYDADDLLDSISLDLSGKFQTSDLLHDETRDKVRNMILSSPMRLSIPNKVKKINDELEMIACQMESLHIFMPKLDFTFSGQCMTNIAFAKSSCMAGSSLVDEGIVIGRVAERSEIVCWLLEDRMEEKCNVSVIPIVAMGGIGKTTLAKLAYNDCQVVDHFKMRMWVSVSTSNFDVVKITKSIIECVTGENCDLSDLHPLQVKLQKSIENKKFLLVLDDIWSENHEDWDVLFSSLGTGSQGSRVIVTTRSGIVSSIVGSGPVINLSPLDDAECWEVMKQKALSNKDLEKNVPLVKIGMNIAKKCKGLPLAAKTLGSVLRFKFSEQEWISILESELWDLPEDKNEIYPSLALSYYYLPIYLKKCFVYYSIFPKNHHISMDELVLLWMAEGFIMPRGKIRLEQIGEEYFMDLVWRSFFQISHTIDVGGVSKNIYVMHDLMHDLAHLMSLNTCISLQDNFCEGKEEFRSPRHISYQLHSSQPSVLKVPNWYEKLRTFILLSENSSCIPQIPRKLFSRLKSVRTLSLKDAGIDELSDSIQYVKHLRYLNLSGNHIRQLPASICKLAALQTLKLNNCEKLLDLPKDFKNLGNLRHLHLDVKRQLNSMPPDFGRLTNLQTLSGFAVGKEKTCGISELKNLQFLRGSICIKNIDNVENPADAREARFESKSYLEKVEFEWKYTTTSFRGHLQFRILENLKPHENVKSLVITNYSGSSFPGWLSQPSCKLSDIELRSCGNCCNLPSLGQLPDLKSLCIRDMPSLIILDRRLHGHGNLIVFPALERLTLINLPSLTEWRELDGNGCPRLRSLTIENCNSLFYLPSLEGLASLESLEFSMCPNLQSLPAGRLPASLRLLSIQQCQILKSRFRFNYEDWEKINAACRVEIDQVIHFWDATIGSWR